MVPFTPPLRSVTNTESPRFPTYEMEHYAQAIRGTCPVIGLTRQVELNHRRNNFRLARHLTTILSWDRVFICPRALDIPDPRAFPYIPRSRCSYRTHQASGISSGGLPCRDLSVSVSIDW